MKKVFYGSVSLVFLFFIHGCSNETQELTLAIQTDPATKAAFQNYLEIQPNLRLRGSDIEYAIRVVEPDPTVDYKLIIIEPDPNINYSLRIIDPNPNKESMSINEEITSEMLQKWKEYQIEAGR